MPTIFSANVIFAAQLKVMRLENFCKHEAAPRRGPGQPENCKAAAWEDNQAGRKPTGGGTAGGGTQITTGMGDASGVEVGCSRSSWGWQVAGASELPHTTRGGR
jgi:hypothetical protein